MGVFNFFFKKTNCPLLSVPIAITSSISHREVRLLEPKMPAILSVLSKKECDICHIGFMILYITLTNGKNLSFP